MRTLFAICSQNIYIYNMVNTNNINNTVNIINTYNIQPLLVVVVKNTNIVVENQSKIITIYDNFFVYIREA